jgi:hypothetical protein
MAILSPWKPDKPLPDPSARPQGRPRQPANDNHAAALRLVLDDLAARRVPRSPAEITTIRRLLRYAPASALHGNPEAMRHWRYSFFPLDRHVAYDAKFHAAKAMTPAERMAEVAELALLARSMQTLVDALKAETGAAAPEGQP